MTSQRAAAFAGLVPGSSFSLTVVDNGKGMDEGTCSGVSERLEIDLLLYGAA